MVAVGAKVLKIILSFLVINLKKKQFPKEEWLIVKYLLMNLWKQWLPLYLNYKR